MPSEKDVGVEPVFMVLHILKEMIADPSVIFVLVHVLTGARGFLGVLGAQETKLEDVAFLSKGVAGGVSSMDEPSIFTGMDTSRDLSRLLITSITR